MPVYTVQQLDLEMDMGIDLDNVITCTIIVTRPAGTSVSHSASRVGQTSRVRHVFTPTELGIIGAGRMAFNPQADFGAGNVVPGRTRFLELKTLGT